MTGEKRECKACWFIYNIFFWTATRCSYRGRFIMLSVIRNIYNKKIKGPTLMELFTTTGKLVPPLHNYRCSMCAPRVTRHTSIRYSSSCNTRVNMGASIFFTAAMIRAFRSARSRGNGGTNTWSLTYPQRKNSQGVMSGDLGGHSINGWSFPDARPIQRPGNTVARYWRTSQ
jgi:hypothetical protein